MEKFPLDMDDILSDMQSLRVSALSRAALISPFVQGRTIGPDCAPQLVDSTGGGDDSENDPNLSNVSAESDEEPVPERYVPNLKVTINREVGRRVDLSELGSLVSFRMFEQERERDRRKEVAEVLEERQARIREVDRLRDKRMRERQKKAEEEAARKAWEREQKLLEAIREQDRLAKEFEERNNAEIEAENRRLAEVSEQLRRKDEEMKRKQALFEAIRTHQGNFRKMTDVFTKTLQSKAELSGHFNAQKKSVQTVVKAFEQLLHGVNASREVSQQDVDRAVEYCKQMEQINAEVGEILARIQKEAAERLKKEQEQAEAQKQLQQQQQAVPEVAPVPQDTPDTTAATRPGPSTSNPLAAFVSQESLAFYTEIKTFYEQHQTAVKTLLDDVSMKTYRFSCQKAINTPVNAISAVSREHFVDKFNKLDALLGGQQVRIGDQSVSINAHPLGRTYCTMLMAKKFVSQADTAISSNPLAAFPIATIIVALWQKYPDFGKMFLAYLHKECPYLVPYNLPQLQGQSQEDYLKSIGYRFSADNVLEKHDQYLKRLTGLARLYGAVIVANLRRGETAAHPHGLECGWRWLGNILNLAPLPDVSATLIQEFLQTAGGLMWQHYGRQFVKVLRVMLEQYLPALNKVDEGGPKSRLEGLVAKITTEGKIDRPDGMMSADFW